VCVDATHLVEVSGVAHVRETMLSLGGSVNIVVCKAEKRNDNPEEGNSSQSKIYVFLISSVSRIK